MQNHVKVEDFDKKKNQVQNPSFIQKAVSILGTCCQHSQIDLTDHQSGNKQKNSNCQLIKGYDSIVRTDCMMKQDESISKDKNDEKDKNRTNYNKMIESVNPNMIRTIDTNLLDRNRNKKQNIVIDSLPKLRLFILKCRLPKLCLITQKHFNMKRLNKIKSFEDRIHKSEHRNSIEPRCHYICDGQPCQMFGLLGLGIQIDQEIWDQVTPEKIANHVARRCRNQGVIFDVFGGVGGNTIAFAKENELVIVMEKQPNRSNYILNNVSLYQLERKVEILTADFLLNQFQINVDLIFLNPDYLTNEYPFSIFSHICPDIKQSLKEAMSITDNIVIQFPGWTDIYEIGELFLEYKGPIEVEYIYFNNSVEKVVVYYGKVANISNKQQEQCLIDHVNKDVQNKYIRDRNQQFLKQQLQQNSLDSLIKLVPGADQIYEHQQNHESYFQVFIDQLRKGSNCSINPTPSMNLSQINKYFSFEAPTKQFIMQNPSMKEKKMERTVTSNDNQQDEKKKIGKSPQEYLTLSNYSGCDFIIDSQSQNSINH